MSKEFYTAIDLNKNELRQAVIENRTSAPTSPVAGLVYFDLTSAVYMGYNGTAWVNLGKTNPYGLNKEVQFNDSGSFGTDPNFTFDKATGILSAPAVKSPYFYGSSIASGVLTLSSTTFATKGKILFGTSAYDEYNNRLGIGTASPTNKVEVITGSAEAIAVTPTSNYNALTGLRLNVFGGTERGGFYINPSTGEIRVGGTNGGGYFPTFFSNGVEYMRINTSGAVMINTATNSAYNPHLFIAKTNGSGNAISLVHKTDLASEWQINPFYRGISNIGFDIEYNETRIFGLTSVGNLGLMGASNATSVPSARLHLISTTEQLRVGYDAINYASFSSASNGDFSIVPTSGVLNVGSAGVSSAMYLYNSGVAKLYLGGAGAIATTSGGNFSIGSSATNVFSGDIYLNRQSAGLFGIGTNSTNALGGIALSRINLNDTANTITLSTLKNSNNGIVLTAYHGVKIIRNTGVYSEPVLDIYSNDTTTTGVDILNVRNSTGIWFSIGADGILNSTRATNIGKLTGGGNAQVITIGHNGTTSSSSDGVSSLIFKSQFGTDTWKFGAEGNGYNFVMRQGNGGQGTFKFDFGTIASTAYSTEWQYVTDHYENILTGKWLTTFSGTGASGATGAYYGFKNSITPADFNNVLDTFRIERVTNNGYYIVAQDAVLTFFNGSSTGTANTFDNRAVARINRMGYLGIGISNAYGANAQAQQAMITLDNPTFTGYASNGITVAQVRTVGSSTSAVFLNTPNGCIGFGIHVGSQITANGVTRTVTAISSANGSVTLDSAVNWDNGGAGYNYTFRNPFVSFQDGSTKYFYISPTGLVGIGTNTPSAKLHVLGEVRVSGSGGQFRLLDQTTNQDSFLLFSPTISQLNFYDTQAGVSRMIIDNSGRIGIGGISPVAKMDIVTGIGDGSANEANCFRLRASTVTGNTMTLQIGVSTTGIGGANQGYSYLQSNYWGGSLINPIILNPKGGQVGIGAVAGLYWGITVADSVGIRASSASASSANGALMGKVVFANYASYGTDTSFIAGIYDKSAWYQGTGMGFYTVSGADISGSTGIERMRISSDGLVSIGGTAGHASALLDLISTTLGLGVPSMTTTQKNAISSPRKGLVVYDTTLDKLCVRGASAWETVTSV